MKGQQSLNNFPNREALWFETLSRSHHSAQLKAERLGHPEITFYESGRLSRLFSKDYIRTPENHQESLGGDSCDP